VSKVAVAGGLGRVGLPLCLALCEAGFTVCAVDRDVEKAQMVRAGRLPFIEERAADYLTRHIGGRMSVELATDARALEVYADAETIVVTLGTPLDEYQNPRLEAVLGWFRAHGHILNGQLVILRSTVFPGTTAAIHRHLLDNGIKVDLAFCPERILQGKAIEELQTLPQIVSATSLRALQRAAWFFESLNVPIVQCEVAEAELAKLFLNSWRYVSFAAANQFFQLAHELGVDYKRVEAAMKEGYSRADALPSPGFAAGPCLLKDTMQLVAASSSGFPLGQAARHVNERLPETIISRLIQLHGPIEGATIGILGMAFKADNDDTRDSLSFKLKKQLEFAGATVLCSDEHAESRRDWVTMEELLARSSGVVIGVPHRAYHGLVVPNGTVCLDVWGVTP
jgi:UDP-N-acetyl-D-mannosaminuronic acid dehydrogenase